MAAKLKKQRDQTPAGAQNQSAAPARKKQEGELTSRERWYPIQVKQRDKVGRPDIDAFEAMIMRKDCDKGFFVAFDHSNDAMIERGSSIPQARTWQAA